MNKEELVLDLKKFLVFYNLYTRLGPLPKELNVKTPCEAVCKCYELKPELFKISPVEFKNKIVLLNQNIINLHQHPCET